MEGRMEAFMVAAIMVAAIMVAAIADARRSAPPCWPIIAMVEAR
jgi:hypothetical protein